MAEYHLRRRFPGRVATRIGRPSPGSTSGTLYTSRRVRRGNVADPSALPCVLVVADRERVGELVAALSELPRVEVMVSSGGDDTIDLFAARRAAVVVLTASLEVGDTKALIVTLRAMVPRAAVAIVVVGDDAGPIRTALDALELAPDRFVTRPLSPKALRFAVTGGIDAVRIVRGQGALLPPAPQPVAMGTVPGRVDPEPAAAPAPPSGPPPVPRVRPLPALPALPAVPAMPAAPVPVDDAPTAATRAALRARWEALADSIVDGAELDEIAEPGGAAVSVEPSAPLSPPIVIRPRRRQTDAPVDAPVDNPACAAEHTRTRQRQRCNRAIPSCE